MEIEQNFLYLCSDDAREMNLAHRENRRASSDGPFRHACFFFFFFDFITVDKDKHNTSSFLFLILML